MNWTRLIRETHRWLSIAFTMAVIANIVAMLTRKPGAEAAGQTQSDMLVGLLALFPLILLLFTGLYLFALPYVTRWRRAGAAAAGNAPPPQSHLE
jgi:D-alanyl-lipoteichoic acid acyltransferase DltB (MBOAT superfamily)